MPSDNITEADDDTSQAEIEWAEGLLEGFKPIGIDDKGNGEADTEAETEPEVKDEDAVDDKADDTPGDPNAIGEADYAKNVAIKSEDGSVSYKTVKQLLDEGMFEADYTRKSQELARQRERLSEDQGILKMLDQDQHARDYLVKRLDDIKSGKPMDAADDIDIPAEVLEHVPGLKKLVDKVMEHDVEMSKSRTNREQTQADQQVGKIGSIMEAALTAVSKETGLKLEPDVFRARVGKTLIASLSDEISAKNRLNVVSQMMLADKDYFLSKARQSYQPEIELAKEKTIDSAKQERAKKAQKPKSLKGSGASALKGDLADFKMTKDKDGRPDMDAFLDDAFKPGKGAR